SGISSFQALAVSISGRVGTGNIAGVATAIALGGPGAIFWMWAIAFLGSASAYIEATLAQIYKVEKFGEYRGGPAYYIEKGLGQKWYAILFVIVTIIAMGLFLPGVQSNSIALGLEHAFQLPRYITGIVIVAFLGLIIFGGIKRIGNVAQIVVPFMSIAYMIAAIIIIAMNIEKVPGIFMLIINSAFGSHQAFAGIVGSAISWGVKRGIYSNEAGQGSAPHAAAAAEVTHPAKQGLVQAFSVYVDTLFICSATAFMILITGTYNVITESAGAIVENIPGVQIGPAYTQMAVESSFGFGAEFVGISLFFFAFTTLMAYYYIAETNVAYLEKSSKQKWMITALRIMILGSTFYGAVKTAKLAWGLGDLGVGMMAWLNIIAIVLLSKPALKALRDYERQKSEGLDPTFDPKKLGIKNADFWNKT
ncbi:MAG: alanine:cation symporter family protein, partial [Deltaproteobacteria bacterium]|nr:alanine:cation symporter family protein [Deltaproteobacteria bacterium]